MQSTGELEAIGVSVGSPTWLTCAFGIHSPARYNVRFTLDLDCEEDA